MLELLIWARAQGKQIEIYPTNFNVNQVFKKAVSSLQLNASKKDVKIVLLDENNPFFAYADIPTINTVIRNLISNAIKFTNSEGTISLQAELVKKEIKISVIDTGIGMANLTKDQIGYSENIRPLIRSSVSIANIGPALAIIRLSF